MPDQAAPIATASNSSTPTASISDGPDAGAPWRLIALIACVLGAAFFVNEVDWRISTYDDYSLEADDAEALVATGSSSRKITYAAIGLAGLLLLLAASRQPRRWGGPALLFLAAYLLICMASVAWSDDPALSLKRLAILGFCAIGAAGVAKHITARDLLNVTICVAFFLVGTGVCVELALGTFQPFSSEYRLAGTVHPNTQGAYCAVLAIACFFGAKGAGRSRLVYLVAFAIALGLLLLTKSRASCAGCLIALASAWLLSAGRVPRMLAGIGGPLAICLILIASLLAGMELTGQLDRTARLGRAELDSSVEGFNGRLPLWTQLMSFVGERPLLGYGYNGFWTPQRIQEISNEHEWTIATAHSVFIDVLLNVGILGGLFFGIAISLAIFQAAGRCARGGASGDAFVFALAMFALVSGMFESGFAQPTGFDAFIVACGLLQVVSAPSHRVASGPLAREVTSASPQTVPLAGGAGVWQ